MSKGLEAGRESIHSAAPEYSLYDILVAWQAGRLPYRRALALTGMDKVTDLYEAAANSGVAIRIAMLPNERRAAAQAIDACRALGASRAPNT